TAAPKVPVRAAVANSKARREIIGADVSINQPSLLGGNLAHVLDVLLHELVKLSSDQKSVGLRRSLDVFLPLGRALPLLHQLDVENHLICRDLSGQPDRARLLEFRDVETGFDARENVVPAFRRGDVRPLRQSLRAEGAQRALRAAAPLPKAFARVIDMRVD